MDSIELWSGTTKALVDAQGGWLTNLADESGAILYPRRTLQEVDGTTRVRGGLHVCVPNFGPGGESGLERHGFARNATWEVIERDMPCVRLMLRGGAPGYEGLVSMLRYTLGEASLMVTLELKNEGDTPLRVAPGFHPYFILQDGERAVKLDGDVIHLGEVAGTEFVDKTVGVLATQQRKVHIATSELTRWAIWTDQLGPYICVEPTFAGNAFVLGESPVQLLAPGASNIYSATFSWPI